MVLSIRQVHPAPLLHVPWQSASRVERPRCPLSDLPMTPWLVVPFDWRRPDAENSRQLRLYRCAASEYGQVFPIPSAEDVASFYDVPSYYTHGSAPERRGLQRPLERLRVHLAWRGDNGTDLSPAWAERHAGPPPASVCEIGCGDGALLSAFTAAGYTGVGVEPDPKARGRAMQRGLEVHDGTAESLPPQLPRGAFRLVVLSHVLEHTRDPLRALANAASLLSPSGKLVFETPNSRCLGFRRAEMAWRFFDAPRHLHFFTERSLRLCAARTGLFVEAVQYTGYCRQFCDEWIDEEHQIAELFRSAMGSAPRPKPRLAGVSLLAQTLFASDEHKYDSVRIVATRR